MSIIDWGLIYAIAVVVHGIGHILGVIMVSELIKLKGFTNESWLLTEKLGIRGTALRALAVIWIVPIIGFLAVAWGFWFGLEWWRLLAGAMVVLSVALFVLWWNAGPKNIPIQANIGNLVVIIGMILL
ncbi:MAG: hypothetical protein ACFFC7_06895 [Candidatus Hermodarchaeota archaeon]